MKIVQILGISVSQPNKTFANICFEFGKQRSTDVPVFLFFFKQNEPVTES